MFSHHSYRIRSAPDDLLDRYTDETPLNFDYGDEHITLYIVNLTRCDLLTHFQTQYEDGISICIEARDQAMLKAFLSHANINRLSPDGRHNIQQEVITKISDRTFQYIAKYPREIVKIAYAAWKYASLDEEKGPAAKALLERICNAYQPSIERAFLEDGAWDRLLQDELWDIIFLTLYNKIDPRILDIRAKSTLDKLMAWLDFCIIGNRDAFVRDLQSYYRTLKEEARSLASNASPPAQTNLATSQTTRILPNSRPEPPIEESQLEETSFYVVSKEDLPEVTKPSSSLTYLWSGYKMLSSGVSSIVDATWRATGLDSQSRLENKQKRLAATELLFRNINILPTTNHLSDLLKQKSYAILWEKGNLSSRSFNLLNNYQTHEKNIRSLRRRVQAAYRLTDNKQKIEVSEALYSEYVKLPLEIRPSPTSRHTSRRLQPY